MERLAAVDEVDNVDGVKEENEKDDENKMTKLTLKIGKDGAAAPPAGVESPGLDTLGAAWSRGGWNESPTLLEPCLGGWNSGGPGWGRLGQGWRGGDWPPI